MRLLGPSWPHFLCVLEVNMDWAWAPLAVIIVAIVVGSLSVNHLDQPEPNVTFGFVVFSIVAMLSLGMVIGKILL